MKNSDNTLGLPYYLVHEIVYRFAFNGKEKDNETYGEGNAYDFGARIYDVRIGRWLSVDPLQKKYVGFTPYNFVLNSPLVLVDPNGKENIIYLIILPDASGFLKENARNIANKANEHLELMGLNTRVQVVEYLGPLPPDFDPKNMDKTDAVAVIGGSRKSTAEYVKRMDESFGNKISTWPEKINPERSETDGDIIALSDPDIVSFSPDVNYSINETAALLILHGAGHNAGNPGTHEEPSIIEAQGKDLVKYREQGRDLFNINDNATYINNMKLRFGEEMPKDNYQKNKANLIATGALKAALTNKGK